MWKKDTEEVTERKIKREIGLGERKRDRSGREREREREPQKKRHGGREEDRKSSVYYNDYRPLLHLA